MKFTARRLAVLAALMVVVLFCLLWLSGVSSIRELLQPRFRVLAIDSASGTMTLVQVNRTYTVRCGEHCRLFAAGRSYVAAERGGMLSIRARGATLELPILGIHVEFGTYPGGLG